MEFCHLHIHSAYSFLDGYGLEHQFMERLDAIGHEAVGITEHGNLFSHIPFWKAGKDAGKKVLLGIEAYLVDDATVRERGYYHITLYAKNQTGLYNLRKLVTASYQRQHFYYKPRIDWSLLKKYQEGLIVLSGCAGDGFLYSSRTEEYKQDRLKFLQHHFQDDFYVELAPNEHNHKKYGEIIQWADQIGAKLVNGTDAHFPAPEDHVTEDIMLCIGMQDDYHDSTRMRLSSELYLFDESEVADRAERYYHIDEDYRDRFVESIQNSMEIADKCDVEIKPLSKPVAQVPKDIGKTEHFKQLISAGVDRLNLKAKANWDVYQARLDREMKIIIEKDFVDYFIIIADLVNWAKQHMLVGSGRGSVGGSLIAYVMNITTVDPIKHGLIFERFIDVSRYDPPDIDLDFPDEKRQMVIDYLFEKYGIDHTALMGTLTTFKPKNSLWDVARIYNVPHKATKKMTNAVIERSSADARANLCLVDTIEENPAVKKIVKQYPDLRQAVKLEGQIRGHGVHAAAVLVSDDPLYEAGAMLYDKDGNQVLMIDKSQSKAVDLEKIDVLALKQLTVIENVLKMIGKDYEWLYNLPLDDESAFQILRDDRFAGIFQYEGIALQLVTRDVVPDNFEHIALISALARPGALHAGGTQKYIEYRAYDKGFTHIKHPKKPEYLHPILEAIASDTYGVVVYQEQVLQIMRDVGNMKWSETTTARLGMSKRMGVEYFSKLKATFVAGALENGLTKKDADVLWEQMQHFGSWAFNKSHATCYGYISYWTLYLKAHHPGEFYTCSLQKETETESMKKLLREWEAIGGEFRVLDIDKSDVTFSLKDGVIYGGMENVKGIGHKTAEKIINMRPFTNVDYYKQHVSSTVQKALTTLECLPEFTAGQTGLFQDNPEVIPAPRVPSDDTLYDLAPWADLHPIARQWQWLLDEYDVTFIQDVDDQTQDVKMVVKVISLNLRDLVEAGIHQDRDISQFKRPDLREFLLMNIEDDTGTMLAGINRFRFPMFKTDIMEAGVGSIITIVGRKVSGFHKIDIHKCKVLQDGNDNILWAPAKEKMTA